MTRIARYSLRALALLALVALTGCGEDSNNPTSPPPQARVMAVHASPDAPAVDVAVTGGAVLLANRAFQQYTPFTAVNAGTYDLELRTAGSATVLLSVPNVSLQVGKIYTVFAKGFLNGTGAQALGAQMILNN